MVSQVDSALARAPEVYGIRGEYQRAETTMSMREGLDEYYRVNPGLSVPATIGDPKSRAYFHNHDCTHVVFGTHTGPLDEGVNDLFTLWGVDLRYRDYITGFLATDESKEIVKSYFTVGLLVRVLWQTLRLLPRVRRTCKAMSKRWPWTPPDAYLDRPLAELRAEFCIELWRPDEALGLSGRS